MILSLKMISLLFAASACSVIYLILKSQLFRSFTSVYLFGKLWNPVWPYTQNLLYYTKHWILFFCLENLKGALPKMFNISWVFALLLFWLHFSHNTTNKPLLLKWASLWNVEISGNLWFIERKWFFMWKDYLIYLFVCCDYTSVLKIFGFNI